MSKLRENVIGNTYGQLLVTGDAPYRKQARQVFATCSCGNSLTVLLGNIKKGTTTSCGCVHKSSVTSHGKSRDPLYKTWYGMVDRCTNPKHDAYSRYGGSGISVCDDWLELSSFLSWANTCGDITELSLDRKDNTKGYCPDNCRWVSRTVQQRNRGSHAGSSSSYVGVSFFKLTGKWKAHIKVNKKLIHLGYFHDELTAAKARDQYIVDNKLQDFTMNGVL